MERRRGRGEESAFERKGGGGAFERKGGGGEESAAQHAWHSPEWGGGEGEGGCEVEIQRKNSHYSHIPVLNISFEL